MTGYRISRAPDGSPWSWRPREMIAEGHTDIRPATDEEAALIERIAAHRNPPALWGGRLLRMMEANYRYPEPPAPEQLDDIVAEVRAEVEQAESKFNPLNSAHEGFAVLLEEVDELKAHVWTNPARRDVAAMRAEAIQVAAMAIRFVRDCCGARARR